MAQIGWQQFSTRVDIIGLPLHEQKRRFLIENNARLQEDYHIMNLYGGGSSGGGGGFGGAAIDGPLSGAKVSANTGNAITDATGKFTLPIKPSGPIFVTGGTDTITGLPYEGVLVGYPEYKTISPITTFAHYLKEASAENPKTPTLTIDEAITKTFVDSFDYFGISLPIEDKDIILQKDYIEESIVNNNKVGITAQAIAIQIEAIAETIGVALEGSQQAQAATKAGKVIPEFSITNRKRSAYEALGRTINNGGNSSTIVSDTIENIIYWDPVEGVSVEGVSFESSLALPNQLAATISELASLAKQEQYTNNYLTTRIQAVNRAQKTIIKNEVKRTVENPESWFSNIDEVSASPEVENALKRIEKDKANETTPTLDGKAITIPLVSKVSSTKFLQLKTDKATGTLVLQQLELNVLDQAYYYFGEAKDAPLLLTEFEGVYQPKNFTGISGPFNTTAITFDSPLYIEVTTSSATFDTVTTYTFRPTQSNRKGEPGIQVTLRLSQITEKKTEKVIEHIVDSEVGTYTATYTALPKGEPVTFTTSVLLDVSGNVLVINPPKDVVGLNGYQLGRFGKEPTTLLTLTAPKLLGVNIQDLVFKDNELNISIPASSGQEEAVMHIGFTLGAAKAVQADPIKL